MNNPTTTKPTNPAPANGEGDTQRLTTAELIAPEANGDNIPTAEFMELR